ncbi:hypothetical protein [Cognatishimia sp. F0-27]|uniref:hypothetical protein n=1 Tax=Cognatishimia sp. F0-27 TaxID=2816855 RepID=UPI001D0C952D|nr:hypothetical protein [Cognatishimia sp. F0-27]MCC1491782.1 hypothetical protein [Cognatishimia sp. F0-27]
MEWLIWGGAAISLAGLTGLVWCIVKVWRARNAGHDDETLRAIVQSVVPINMASLFGSVIGLMMIVLGIFFG